MSDSPRRWLRLTIAYDGRDFHGWQRQPGQRTVQGEVEAALSKVLDQPTEAIASGRTDAGVHAIAQVVGFNTTSRLSEWELLKAVNAELPEDVHARDIGPTPENFDPIRHAKRKRYRYLINDGREYDVFARESCWSIWHALDESKMRAAAKALIGTHDFVAFQTKGSERVTTVRTVHDISVARIPGEFREKLAIEVEADGFLYNMVRNIVGTLVPVGRGKQPIEWPARVLASLDRKQAGMTAPAQGLYLLWVKYE